MIFAYSSRGHDHFWCSEECEKACDFGPCCDTSKDYGNIVSLMHGDGWIRCCICFEVHQDPYLNLAREDGKMWDACSGDCAIDAGIKEDGVTDEQRLEYITKRYAGNEELIARFNKLSNR